MSSAAVGTHSGIGPLSLMSCVRESSPLQDIEDNEKNTSTKKKFWNPKKWFRRKNKVQEDVVSVEIVEKDAVRSRSTSELSVTEELHIRKRSGSSIHPGLSVSHDSVFHSPNSGSDIELEIAQSSSSLSISQPHIDLRLQSELSKKLRLRRERATGDTSEDDEGFPNSPCNSPTTTDALLLNKASIKDLPTKSHSTCSDGSLLSMCSSENDEENQQSRHSSKLSLYERDSEFDFAPNSSTTQLNHSAAHHRVAVRPNKRRAPHRNKRTPQLSAALPITLEVNEEPSFRSMTPDIAKDAVAEISAEQDISAFSDNQFKCSSLPPGLSTLNDGNTLNRSQSNVGTKSQEHFQEKEDKGDKSFFDRIFPRRSAKKRKSKEEKSSNVSVITTKQQQFTSYESKSHFSGRYGAASRQRIEPIDLPASPEIDRKDYNLTNPDSTIDSHSPPLHLELEHRFKQRQTLTCSPPLSPTKSKTFDSITPVISRVEQSAVKLKSDETGNKIKMPNLSALQQKVLSLREEESNKKIIVSPNDEYEIFQNDSVDSFETKAIAPTSEQTSDLSLESVTKHEESASELLEENLQVQDDFCDNITISGPSHTAVVHISDSSQNTLTKTEMTSTAESVNESVSITKIHLKRESTQFTQNTVTVSKSVPEFFNKQLNKVDLRSGSNVVLSMNAPRVVDERTKMKTVEEKVVSRKFSKEELEIVEKSEDESVVSAGGKYKKNEKRKTSTSCESPQSQYSRSVSLDSVKNDFDYSDKSSLDSLEILDSKADESDKVEKSSSAVESVVLRKKSLMMKHKNDEEPELMKVFARRSLKLKDVETEAITQEINSMKMENNKENLDDNEVSQEKESQIKLEDHREPLTESKIIDTKDLSDENKFTESTEVTLRKPVNLAHNYQRAKSVNAIMTKNNADETLPIKKQQSFSDKRKTDNNWKLTVNNDNNKIETNISSKLNVNSDNKIIVEPKMKISQDEIFVGITAKCDLISDDMLIENKNFNQRKAEWEKRAQQAQKKSVP